MNLRQSSDEHSYSSADRSTVEFAQRVEDGLGGSLNTIWGNRNDEYLEENEGSLLQEHTNIESVEVNR